MSNIRRRICYLTGTRADYGLMVKALQVIASDARLDLSVIVTGTHLSNRFGHTITEIMADGFSIAAQIEVDLVSADAAQMSINIGRILIELTTALRKIHPDILLLLGDRGEMIAGALAAIHLGIPIAHLHGGERSGTVDEPVRHAISKLAHIHLVATKSSRNRLIRMGEDPRNVHVVGAPGIDGIFDGIVKDRETLCASVGFDHKAPLGLLVFHPVLQEASEARNQLRAILDAADTMQLLALMPNSDAGSESVRAELQCAADYGSIALKTHLRRDEYRAWLAHCDVLIGNSSSGIIEAASFGTPVINVGSRQRLRERGPNVTDVPATASEIRSAILKAVEQGRYPVENIYGDGNASRRIADLLATTPLTKDLLAKCNAY